MKLTSIVAVLFVSSLAAKSGESAKSGLTDCRFISNSFGSSINGKPIKVVITTLSSTVSNYPECACELIKTSILSYKPRPREVADMVDAAIYAAPDRMEEIVRCAIAAAPDATAEILAVAGEHGFTPNPLDYPGVTGEHPGGPWQFAPTVPIFVNPPPVTAIDP